ncbi:NPCBM/NEW2 domain-containing protein [Deinococcus rufus]|uniref:NPCBM/NEW2 domain-containing protein n=1 Tax=Deinococcus rufus TaxID=2136097 RepID=A0ABV7ZDK7_9DEIO
MTPLTRIFALLLPLSLGACSQQASPTEADPYAGGASHPWSYTRPGGRLSAQALTPGVNTLYYEPILAATNAWGPIELDHSNGERGAGDGRTLTIGGVTYAKGFGVHAGSEMRFGLKGSGATCTRFTVDVGVDDEVGARGSVVFQVYLDGTKAYDSGLRTGQDATKRVDLNITGKQELRLVVTDGGNGISYDHADWANPKITCQAVSASPLTMTVSPGTLSIYHRHSATVKATFSGTFSGPVNLSLPLVDSPEGVPMVLRTAQVSLPSSGTGTVTRDVVIDAPDAPTGLVDPAPLTSRFRLVATRNGQQVASAPLTITERLLDVHTTLTPTTVTGRPGETRRVTVTVQVSPPLARPEPIALQDTFPNEEFTTAPVGPLYGDGGTMKQDFTVTLQPDAQPGIPSFTADYFIQVSNFAGYRVPYYGGSLKTLTWNVQP